MENNEVTIDIEKLAQVSKIEEDLSFSSEFDTLEPFEVELMKNLPDLDSDKLKDREGLDRIQKIYTEIDQDELSKELLAKENVQPQLAIEIKRNSISKLNIGDTISLPNIGEVGYEAIVSKKIVHNNGSVSITGNLVGSQNNNYSMVFTQGKNSSYASFTTPEGAFEIETVNGQGFVYSVKDIEKVFIDPKKEDAISIPKNETKNNSLV